MSPLEGTHNGAPLHFTFLFGRKSVSEGLSLIIKPAREDYQWKSSGSDLTPILTPKKSPRQGAGRLWFLKSARIEDPVARACLRPPAPAARDPNQNPAPGRRRGAGLLPIT